ncbi:homeobox domain-containing protein [Hamiltosporidium tvaerminnensis]|uniref:Homeobox domain-containing protein n=1 Tax=Hamiltosporidium tvaerminnensis TaxID=1176355 RepID=A0A4Q9KU00_9MICR|nr:hypothetical protein LUQ84_000865 [Hamiltosporidium tvaerminnensis]TBT97429.1 homeobox domain-containing protein [Hamiltosporidium tvaerminnensis]
MSRNVEYENFQKTTRLRLTPEKSEYLHRYFEKRPRPTTKEKMEISEKLNICLRSVQIWFQNKRAKLKKDMRNDTAAMAYINDGRGYNANIVPSNNSLYTLRENILNNRPFMDDLYQCRYENNIFYKNEMMPNSDFNVTPFFRYKRHYKFHDCTNDQRLFYNKKKLNYEKECEHKETDCNCYLFTVENKNSYFNRE